jgi:GDPmannose 4,6-dehydratase
MARRTLITGIAGQDGSYLAELLLARGDELTGLDRPEAYASPNLDAVRGSFSTVDGDLRDPASLKRAIAEARPDEIYHLAAPTFVPDSWNDPTQTLAMIAGATGTVLAAALTADPRPRVWVSTSSEIFGDAPQSPQDEDTPMRPRTPYGVAKLAAHGLVRTMREHHGLFACSGITYNHESPRRPPHFLPRKVTRGAAAIALGLQGELVLGDLDAARDWSDARDIVRGAALALAAPEPGEYVFASGRPHTVRELVQAAFGAAGVEGGVEQWVRVDPAFVRPPEPVVPAGNSARARELLGWVPEIPFEQTIADMVAADLAELRVGATGS